ncbi:MAG: hypothetical protein AB8H12_10875 [Lewinella sp.]
MSKIPGPDAPEEHTPTKGEELAEKAQAAYRWWDNLATFHAEDPLWLGAAKIGIRVVGILVLLAMSPLILLGLLLALMAVS